MTARSKTRSLGCILLVLSLCAPMLTIGAAAADLDRSTEFRPLATPSSTVLLTRAGAGHDHARQRPSAPSLFTPASPGGVASGPGRLAAASDYRLPHSLWTTEPRTGRSPPSIS